MLCKTEPKSNMSALKCSTKEQKTLHNVDILCLDLSFQFVAAYLFIASIPVTLLPKDPSVNVVVKSNNKKDGQMSNGEEKNGHVDKKTEEANNHSDKPADRHQDEIAIKNTLVENIKGLFTNQHAIDPGKVSSFQR